MAGIASPANRCGGGYESPSAQLRRWRASRPWRGALRPDSACPASDLPDPFLFPCDDHVPDDGLGVCVVSVRRRAVRAHLVCVPLCSRLQVSVGVLAARVCVRVCVCVCVRSRRAVDGWAAPEASLPALWAVDLRRGRAWGRRPASRLRYGSRWPTCELLSQYV